MTTDAVTFQLLQNALSASNARQAAFAANIANAQTPGYKRQDVTFETLLTSAISTPTATLGERYIPISTGNSQDLQTMAQVQSASVTDTQTIIQNNGNNVDIDAEMARLAENQIRYNTLIQDVQTRLSRLRTAINGG